MSGSSLPQEVIRFQLAVLDAYDRLLAGCAWDEAKLNQELKTMLITLLPVLRAQRAFGEQLIGTQKELISRYRDALEAALKQGDDAPKPDGGGQQ